MDNVASNVLGSYLRARRNRVRPSDVGLPETSRRRVPGLRREEVATLAGISVDYYLGLEQGRDRRPSADILRALARVLQLNERATSYLFGLAASGDHTRVVSSQTEVSPVLIRMIDSWPITPAFLQNRTFSIVAANTLAQALSPVFAPGVSLIRALFLEKDTLRIEPDPKPDLVACLRGLASTEVMDQELLALVDELSARSEEFRALRDRHDVGGRTNGTMTIAHLQVGTLTLDFERFSVPSAPELQLVVCSAESDSRSAKALLELAKRTAC